MGSGLSLKWKGAAEWMPPRHAKCYLDILSWSPALKTRCIAERQTARYISNSPTVKDQSSPLPGAIRPYECAPL